MCVCLCVHVQACVYMCKAERDREKERQTKSVGCVEGETVKSAGNREKRKRLSERKK